MCRGFHLGFVESVGFLVLLHLRSCCSYISMWSWPRISLRVCTPSLASLSHLHTHACMPLLQIYEDQTNHTARFSRLAFLYPRSQPPSPLSYSKLPHTTPLSSFSFVSSAARPRSAGTACGCPPSQKSVCVRSCVHANMNEDRPSSSPSNHTQPPKPNARPPSTPSHLTCLRKPGGRRSLRVAA